MAVSLKSLGIESLGIDDRLALIEELWEGIPSESGAIPMTAAQRDELDRRLGDHEANPDDVVSWEEVKSSLEKRLKA
jgi:putative addiction module component (TIGR02574 family)